jgi:hypothetical protein
MTWNAFGRRELLLQSFFLIRRLARLLSFFFPLSPRLVMGPLDLGELEEELA